MKRLLLSAAVALGIAAVAPIAPIAPAHAGSDPYVGTVSWFGGNFAPRGWALCDGQLLPIAQYSALFSLLGTTYGGDGRTTFGLPDMRGRSPVHAGSGPGLSTYAWGAKGGAETVALNGSTTAAHTHDGVLKGVTAAGASASPQGSALAVSPVPMYASRVSSLDATLLNGSLTVAATGNGQPHENRSPVLGVNCIISLQGIYPSRS